MVTLKTMKVGESFTLGILIPENYALPDAQEIKIYIGGQVYPHTLIDRMIRCELTSDMTSKMYGGREVDFWLDDVNWGVRKYRLGNIVFTNIPAPAHNESIHTGYDVIVNLSIQEQAITISDIIFNYVKGDSALQTWQQIPGNEGKTWDDFVVFMQEPAAAATQAAWDSSFSASLATSASLVATTSSLATTSDSLSATTASILATQASIVATDNASLVTQASILATQSSSLATADAIIATESASLATLYANTAAQNATLASQSAVVATFNTIQATESASLATLEAGKATESASLATGLTMRAIESASIATLSASQATLLALEVAEHPDIIQDDYWWKWNTALNIYEDTGIKAKGDVQYTTFYLDPETGILSQTLDTDLQNTTFSLVSGNLILSINNI